MGMDFMEKTTEELNARTFDNNDNEYYENSDATHHGIVGM